MYKFFEARVVFIDLLKLDAIFMLPHYYCTYTYVLTPNVSGKQCLVYRPKCLYLDKQGSIVHADLVIIVYSYFPFSGQFSVLSQEVSQSSSTLTYQCTKHETIVIFCEVTHTDSSSTEKVVSNKAKISIRTCKFYIISTCTCIYLNL